jgi:copper chaperone CopZ
MVSLALDESEGVLEYDINLGLSKARVTYDGSAVDLPGILAAITKRTGYENLTVDSLEFG